MDAKYQTLYSITCTGIADLLIEERDGLVVVDWKTDEASSEAELRNAAARHRTQVSFYAQALSEAAARPVRGELFLCAWTRLFRSSAGSSFRREKADLHAGTEADGIRVEGENNLMGMPMPRGRMRELLCLASLLLVFASLPSCGGPEMPANGLGDSTGGTGGGGGGGGPTGGGGGSPGDPPPPTPDPPPPPPAGDPNAGLSFLWKVNSVNVTPPAFVDAPGPAGAAKNEMSRLQYSPQLALTLYRRWIPGSAVSLLEVAIWNDPLTCTNQPVAGA